MRTTVVLADDVAAAGHLLSEFAILRGRGGPGDESTHFELRLAWEQELARAGWTWLGWPKEHGGRAASLNDTSETMVDVSIQKLMGDFDPRGVNPQLCTLVRRALDREGFEQVKIVASGGFNVEKIERFERERVPVDAYGVGSAFFQGSYDFTADVVMVEGRPCAKAGRRFRPNPRLEPVT